MRPGSTPRRPRGLGTDVHRRGSGPVSIDRHFHRDAWARGGAFGRPGFPGPLPVGRGGTEVGVLASRANGILPVCPSPEARPYGELSRRAWKGGLLRRGEGALRRASTMYREPRRARHGSMDLGSQWRGRGQTTGSCREALGVASGLHEMCLMSIATIVVATRPDSAPGIACPSLLPPTRRLSSKPLTAGNENFETIAP